MMDLHGDASSNFQGNVLFLIENVKTWSSCYHGDSIVKCVWIKVDAPKVDTCSIPTYVQV